ncbi:alpha/beta-hydrolase [Coprinellus micaceus]|uniref:Alpha/beta-hydrolase n=1 Tax=Coprinellus micaceus TaxID=71717 RepID=A0A4Y7SYZ9_COPMI|nr:alpha/beta-hydrolase [Coprinellus micaceus]
MSVAWSRGLSRRIVPNARRFSRVHGQEQTTVPLAFTPLGHGTGSPLVVLHGLFGCKRNWKTLTKALHRSLPNTPIYTLDLRNHGSSPHARPHTYQAMAVDVQSFITEKGLQNVSLIGHSMGAKVAMTVALNLAKARKSDLLSRLVVVDMAPAKLLIDAKMRNYVPIMQNMNSMPAGMIKSLVDAERFLMAFEEDPVVRQFLLTNLVLPSHSRATAPHHDKAKFALPLDILKPAIDALEEFPYDHTSDRGHPIWAGPTRVIAGRNSEYRVFEQEEALKAFFPNHDMHVLDTGHWVQAEKPNEFLKLVVDFLKPETGR